MQRHDVYVRVCCLREDPDVILGYAICEGDHILHYVHVKEAWRKFGIATSLLPKKFDVITFVTLIGFIIVTKKYPMTRFLALVGPTKFPSKIGPYYEHEEQYKGIHFRIKREKKNIK